MISKHFYHLISFLLLLLLCKRKVTCFQLQRSQQHQLKRPKRRFLNTDNTRLYMSSSSSSWESHVSTHPVGLSALRKVLDELSSSEKNKKDLMFLFVGQSHADDFESIVRDAHRSLPDEETQLVSILGGGVIGDNVELDKPGQPCLSIMAGNLPDNGKVEFLTGEKELLSSAEGDNEKDRTSYLLLADPFTSELESIMKTLSSSSNNKNTQVSGGITCPPLSATSGPSLAVNNKILQIGTVLGVKFTGNVGFQTLVAQGCRPIFNKKSFVVTDVINGNIVTELNGRKALETFQDLLKKFPEESKQLTSGAGGGLLCGLASATATGDDDNMINNDDYLCRQVMGFAPDYNGILIGGTKDIQKGDRLIYQIRDKDTAEKDMKLMVQRAKTSRMFTTSKEKGQPLAVFQISCVARGRGLFEIPNMDISQLEELVDDDPNVPIAGFYANGEIGPVGLSGFTTKPSSSSSSCHLHGFTTVASILCDYSYNDDDKSSSQISEEEEINNNENSDNYNEDAWG